MAVWIAKAITQKFISFLPYRHKINYLFQKHITKGLELTDELFQSKLLHCHQHITAWKEYGNKEKFVSLELGTGWYPVVPVGMFLHGAERIYSADIESLLTVKKSRLVLQKFADYHRSGRLKEYIGDYDSGKIDVIEEILSHEYDLQHVMDKLHITRLIGDITSANIITEVDLIHSNNTFEHIPEPGLERILVFFRNIISPNGVMSHFIDMSDHFSHLDKKITPYNFLKFSETRWKLIDNRIQPQNRLRISDYRKLFTETSWRVVKEDSIPGKPADFEVVKLSGIFHKNSDADNMVTHSWMVSRPM